MVRKHRWVIWAVATNARMGSLWTSWAMDQWTDEAEHLVQGNVDQLGHGPMRRNLWSEAMWTSWAMDQ